jgi:hypothetical protein
MAGWHRSTRREFMSSPVETLEQAYSLEQFVADTRRSLKTKPGPEGVEEVRQHLEQLLRNPNLLRDHLGDPPPFGTHCIHYDPETDVYVLVHGREKAGGASPHDHGPCWVVYGQYTNHTDMQIWQRLDDGSKEGYADLKVGREVNLLPGHAIAMQRGYIHSIAYPDRSFSCVLLVVTSKSKRRCGSPPTRNAWFWKTAP